MVFLRVVGRICLVGGCLTASACAAGARIAPTQIVKAGVISTTKQPTEEPKFAEIVERSMPAVVLLLNTQSDGTQIYGAGLLVERGLALTSQHVVANAKTLGAMLYVANRTSYTPMDGGLSRYLFENQAALVKAQIVAGDSTSDLALIRIDADTSRYPTLPIARDPVKPGDRVLALGHPQETVWSFTQGVVGAIQQGAIQHDAAISHGSSGGPLLNLRGQVVGINIAKVVSESSGLAFARPIALAARYLGDRSIAEAPLDLSTPEAAALGCWRAQEIGQLEVGECFDWESHWEMFFSIAGEAMRMAPPATRERIRNELSEPGYKDRWIEERKRQVAAYFVQSKPDEPAPSGPVPVELARARSEAEREKSEILREHPELRGVYADHKDPRQLLARLRLGIRVEHVALVADDRAWVQLAGRNPDGTVYRFSELYVKIGGRWLQRFPPFPIDVATRPKSFGPMLFSFTAFRARKLDKLLRSGAGSPASPTAARPAPPTTSERCPSTACNATTAPTDRCSADRSNHTHPI